MIHKLSCPPEKRQLSCKIPVQHAIRNERWHRQRGLSFQSVAPVHLRVQLGGKPILMPSDIDWRRIIPRSLKWPERCARFPVLYLGKSTTWGERGDSCTSLVNCLVRCCVTIRYSKGEIAGRENDTFFTCTWACSFRGCPELHM